MTGHWSWPRRCCCPPGCHSCPDRPRHSDDGAAGDGPGSIGDSAVHGGGETPGASAIWSRDPPAAARRSSRSA